MEALQYLNSVGNAHPEISDQCNTLSDLYQRKLWHHLTFELEQFVLLPHFQTGDNLIRLYHNFIIHFETEIYPFTLAHFALRVSDQYPKSDAAIDYLKGVTERLKSSKEDRVEESVTHINMQIALLNLGKGDHKECKNLLDNGKTKLDEMIGVDPSVYGHYYWVLSQYNIFHQDADEFHKNVILSVAYTSLKSMSESYKLYIAFHLTASAMLGDNIYNFGELLEHPIIKGLLGSPFEWIYHILESFNSGNLVRYKELFRVHQTCISSQPALVENQKKFVEKINILWLMEFIFRRSPKDRIFPLTLIAESMQLTVKDVEHLLLKSLSAHLMEGVIDGVDGTVNVTWVKPRHLGITQIEYLRHRLVNWLGKLQWVIISVETGTCEFVAL